MTSSIQNILQSSNSNLFSTASPASSIDSSSPLNPTLAQQQFIKAMKEDQGGRPKSYGYTANYTQQYLQAMAEHLTSATITNPKAVGYPQARRLLAGWYSLLSQEDRIAVAPKLIALAPNINTTILAEQDTIHTSSSTLPGSNPSEAAMAEADKFPNASVKNALDDIVSSMDPSYYQSAGKIAMNIQLITSILSEGIAIMGYLTQNAKNVISGTA